MKGNADAVYFGVEILNMRMLADNFKLDDLGNVVKYCRENKLRTYLTTNIIIYENEISLLSKVLDEAAAAEIDAVIVHDIGAIELAKERNLDFHISTQASVSNSKSAKFYENLGAKRLILARELSLDQIKEIKLKLKETEVETFVHGAQCTSISGRCYFSQDICGTEEKSANRGNCVQPCRRRWWVREESGNEYIYDGVRFMNSRDLCTIAYIPDFIEANIDAFKIEGRMRHPHYVEIVTKVYRKAIEAYYNGTFTKNKVGEWVTELKKVYNRGFTPGFYFKRMTEEDHQHKSPANLSHFRYIKVGKVKSYNPDNKNAIIILNNGYLTKNDDIIVMGKQTDTYIHQKAKEIKFKGKTMHKTPRGTSNKKIEIELELNNIATGNGLDNLYIFTDKTYKKKKYSL